ncbi:MAG: GlsB/YeaQ/YmgE family stress response membrane protein [Bacteroidetes bacterium]|nr:GlsB/YeaQ/YmgE family stress response membrane protein [Bacteroidota bacterium]
MDHWLYVLIVGAISGWLAGQLFRGYGFGLIGNIIIGIVGSFIGFWLFGKLGISLGTGTISTILTSAAGAIVLLFIAGLFRRS